MRARVIVMPAAEEQLLPWLAALAPTPDARVELGASYMTAFRRAFEAGKLPPDARPIPGTDPPAYWAELTGGTWLRFSVTDARAAVFGRATRVVRVTAVSRRPPSASQ